MASSYQTTFSVKKRLWKYSENLLESLAFTQRDILNNGTERNKTIHHILTKGLNLLCPSIFATFFKQSVRKTSLKNSLRKCYVINMSIEKEFPEFWLSLVLYLFTEELHLKCSWLITMQLFNSILPVT